MAAVPKKAYTPILDYWGQIETGKITVCKKVYRTFRKLAYDVEHPGKYHYSQKRADHVIDFAERYCRHSKGKQGGQLVCLELWEKAILAAVFGFVDSEGRRQYREAMLIVAKKNGKSLISSVVGLYLMIADGEPGAEVYAVATKKDQAKIIWLEAKRMVNKSPALKHAIKPLVAELDGLENDSVFKPLASDSDTLDGLNVHGALMDEIHQWRQGAALFNIIADGTTAREQPLVFVTSTAGFVREDIYDEKYSYAERVINGYSDSAGYKDEHFIAFVYELDDRAEWTDSEKWIKANPGLGTIKNRAQLADKVKKAQANPELVKNLLCKEFNIRQNSSSAWLDFEVINNAETFDIKEPRPRYAIGGVDLSSTTDLTAACIIFMLPGSEKLYCYPMFWLAEDLFDTRIREDKIPYDKWLDAGYVRTCPGNRISPSVVTEWFVELRRDYDIYIPYIGYDRWSAQLWVDDMSGYFGKGAMIPIAQGAQTLSAPMKELGADLSAKRINYGNNPVLKWCMMNTAVIEDTNGNIKPIKGARSTARIDGLAALLDAYVVLRDRYNEYLSLI